MALPYYIDKMDNGQSISSQCDSCDCDCIFSEKRSKDRVDMAFGALFYPGSGVYSLSISGTKSA